MHDNLALKVKVLPIGYQMLILLVQESHSSFKSRFKRLVHLACQDDACDYQAYDSLVGKLLNQFFKVVFFKYAEC